MPSILQNSSYRVLAVDDEDALRSLYAQAIASMGYQVDTAPDGTEAINKINSSLYDAVILDIHMPRVDGFEVLSHIKGHSPSTEVIIVTAMHDLKTAVQAIKLGAYDFVSKPIQLSELAIVLARCLEKKTLANSTALLQRSLDRTGADNPAIGVSRVWTALLDKARRFAESDALIYLEGETGSGKEVLAKYIHISSSRKEKPFVAVDCGVIPESLIETELFGYARGAFTGADTAKAGLVELANGGTLFLDEIGHIDHIFQQKLLKFVESKVFRRVGDTSERTVDVRILAATNKNLEAEALAGRFRSDLWYRLNVIRLSIPPLRLRSGDVGYLAEYFVKKYSSSRKLKLFTPEALAVLEAYSWPGNVRELQSTIQRALALSDDDLITADDLGIQAATQMESGESDKERIAGATGTMLVSLHEAERRHIEGVLTSVDWNISRAAKVLQIGRNTLYLKIQEYNLQRPPA